MIETRRRMRNEIEQRTQIEIRTQNLDAQRKALESSVKANMPGSHRSTTSKCGARRNAWSSRRTAPTRDRESEQAQIAAREEIEKSRLVQERNLAEARIQNQEETQQREIARRRPIDEARSKHASRRKRAR